MHTTIRLSPVEISVAWLAPLNYVVVKSCCIRGLQAADAAGVGRVIVETDAAEVVQAVSSPSMLLIENLVRSYLVYKLWLIGRDENGSDTDGYHRYYICFHIFVWIQIRIRIVSTMSDMIRLDIDIINMRFEYSDTDTVSDVGYPDSDTDRSQPL